MIKTPGLTKNEKIYDVIGTSGSYKHVPPCAIIVINTIAFMDMFGYNAINRLTR
jgi:hypothetical protein